MLSERMYTLIIPYSQFANFFGIVPLHWCPKSRLAIPSPRGRKRAIFNTFLMFTWAFFVLCQLVRFHYLKEGDNFNMAYLFGSGTFLSFSALAFLIFKEKDCMDLFNTMISYMRHINNVYLPNYNPNNSKLSIFLEACSILMFLNITIIVPLNWLFAIMFPNSPVYFGNVLPANSLPLPVDFFIRYVVTLYLIFILYYNFLLYGIIILFYGVIIVPFIIWEFRVDRKKSSYYAIDDLRKPPTLWNAWRAVQVFQTRVNSLIGMFIVPTQTYLGKLGVYCAYVVMRYGEEMKISTKSMLLFWALGGAQFWALVLFMGGCVHFYGLRILDSWKYNEWKGLSNLEKKAMAKFRKSCMPVCIAYGKTYVMRRLSVLKFIRGLVTGVFRALLTL